MSSNDLQAEKILDQMVQFITAHGDEEEERIRTSMDHEFTI